jgi:hypothetical protein
MLNALTNSMNLPRLRENAGHGLKYHPVTPAPC